MKIIRYNLCTRVERTAEEGKPLWDDVLTEVWMPWSAVNEEIAKKEAYNGKYDICDDGISETVTSPRNITAGEYVTVGGVLYKATENIPNGESIVVGQNAVVTTVEEQLYELKGE